MTDAEVRAIYPRRMTMGLTPEEIAEIERRHAAMVANPQRVASDPTSLDPNDAAAVEIGSDPPLAPPRAASTPAPVPAEDPGMDRARAGLYANLPPIEDQEAAARAAAPERPEREDWVRRRAAELVRRGRPLTYSEAGTSPEVARARAEAEYDDPNGWTRNPNSEESMSPQVRAAVRRQLDVEAGQRAADLQASVRGGAEPRFNASDFRRQREEAEAAKEADAQRKWDEWATGGSYERMARYAPEEYRLRMEAAAEQRRKENLQEYLNRYDFTVDPKTGMTKGKLYRMAQNQEDKEQLRRTDPQANAILRRELQRMGVDTEPFESNTPRQGAGETESTVVNRNRNFDRTNALAAKSAAKNARFAAANEAVQRRAQLRQNPWEYMGRGDINDEQRRTAAFLLSGGRGATANDVAALDAKMLLEGIGQGVQRGMRIGDMDLKSELAAMQAQRQLMQNAQSAADDFFNNRAERLPVVEGYGLALGQDSYEDLIAMLRGMGLSPDQASGLARRYKRKGGRAERTAPPEA